MQAMGLRVLSKKKKKKKRKRKKKKKKKKKNKRKKKTSQHNHYDNDDDYSTQHHNDNNDNNEGSMTEFNIMRITTTAMMNATVMVVADDYLGHVYEKAQWSSAAKKW
jgi:hypothetical protein